MKVFVTGGGGYLGTTLVPVLRAEGHDVTVLDRFFFGTEHLTSEGGTNGVHLVRDDVRWFDGKLLEGMDAVVDMAALSNDPAGEMDPWKTREINFLGRSRVCRLAREAGVPRYVLTSSCSIYGFRDGLLTEETPVNPLTVYAQANALAERDNLPLASESFCPVAVRMATLYGRSGRMRFDLAVNGMVLGAHRTGKIPVMKDGRQWRPLMHVRDAARAIAKLLTLPAEPVRGRVFNIGSDEQNFQILPLAEAVAAAMPKPPTIEWYGSPDNRSYRVSFARARETLGFRTQFTVADATREIEQGLSDGTLLAGPDTNTVGWYRHLLGDPKAGDAVRLRGVVL